MVHLESKGIIRGCADVDADQQTLCSWWKDCVHVRVVSLVMVRTVGATVFVSLVWLTTSFSKRSGFKYLCRGRLYPNICLPHLSPPIIRLHVLVCLKTHVNCFHSATDSFILRIFSLHSTPYPPSVDPDWPFQLLFFWQTGMTFHVSLLVSFSTQMPSPVQFRNYSNDLWPQECIFNMWSWLLLRPSSLKILRRIDEDTPVSAACSFKCVCLTGSSCWACWNDRCNTIHIITSLT